jgi:NAD(P)-dependent dehydrogenase (short-subunit alcohol dehydrogenase family)
MSVALITGASRGLGRAVARELDRRGWHLVLDARDADALERSSAPLSPGRVRLVPGDVADEVHRLALADAVGSLGRLDLLLNNASDLGPSPLPSLDRLEPERFAALLEVNTIAPLALTQLLLPYLQATRGAVVNVSSDAAVEAYAGWGGYGSSKAALDHLSAVLAQEQPLLSVYALDPGDMRTEMHQAAFPGEDISDRPQPETVVPALLRLLDEGPASGRYRAGELLAGGDAELALAGRP